MPVVAKLFANLPSELAIKVFDAPLKLQLELPFSWIALFFCALFVSLANLIYTFLCPDLIKVYDDFPAFKSSSRDASLLRSALAIFRESKSDGKDIGAMVDFVSTDVLQEIDAQSILNTKHQLAEHGPAGSDSFYFVRDALNLSRPHVRFIASAAYIMGFALLAWISFQNIWFTVSYLLCGSF
ncbi:MAG: hypothetical protein ACO1TE_11220 [Prosthecobacter sp.]